MKKILSIAILLSGISLGFAKDMKMGGKTLIVQKNNNNNSLVKIKKSFVTTKVVKQKQNSCTLIHCEYFYVIEDALYYDNYWICVP